jgi:hypothetical protein
MFFHCVKSNSYDKGNAIGGKYKMRPPLLLFFIGHSAVMPAESLIANC